MAGQNVANCIAFLESGDIAVGDSEGAISVYSVSNDGEYFRTNVWEAHHRGVTCLLGLTEGTILSGGDKDRRIVAWDTNRNFDKIVEAELPSTAGSARTLYPQWPGRNDGNIYVGTNKNMILEGSLQRKFNMVVYGHTRQLSAVATHPDDVAFITAGYDKVVAKWRRSKLIWKLTVQTECLSVCYHPQGSVVAAGTADGHLIVLNADSGSHVTTIRVCGSALNGVKFNPDGDIVAAASQNGSVYLYRASRDGFAYKKYGKMSGGGQLTELDWDETGDYIATASTDFQLGFWNTVTNKLEKVPNVCRNRVWTDVTASLGYFLSGMWNNHNYKNSDALVTTSHVSNDRSLLVAGDSHGYLRLFRYPCVSPKAEFYEEKPVSGSIDCVRFFFDDSYVVTVGGTDASLFKWKMK